MDNETREKILQAYNTSRNSIQDIARIHNVSVDTVLQIIGEGHLGTVAVDGDLIDASEAGPNAEMNYGKEFKVPFTTD